MSLTAAAQVPPRSVSMPREEVDDAFLAYIHGVIMQDETLRIRGSRLRREFPEFDSENPTPFHDIRLFTRIRIAGGARLTINFAVPLEWEVPVDIFGHSPVELYGSRVISFEENWPDMGDSAFSELEAMSSTSTIILFKRISGYLRVDVARWLDFLGGGLVEDVDVTTIALIRYDGEWFAALGGFSPEFRPMIGILNMKETRFMVVPPRPLAELARTLVESSF